MTTFSEFIKDRGVTMESVHIGTSDDDKMFQWAVTVKMDGKQWRSDYRMGMAHCKITSTFGGYTPKDIGALRNKARTISQLQKYCKISPTKPDIESVLYSLQTDAMVKDNYPDKWDFIDEMGYENGREGERVYNLCLEANTKARNFFGTLYNEFTELEED